MVQKWSPWNTWLVSCKCSIPRWWGRAATTLHKPPFDKRQRTDASEGRLLFKMGKGLPSHCSKIYLHSGDISASTEGRRWRELHRIVWFLWDPACNRNVHDKSLLKGTRHIFSQILYTLPLNFWTWGKIPGPVGRSRCTWGRHPGPVYVGVGYLR